MDKKKTVSDKESIFKPLISYAGPHIWLLVIALILAVISVAATLYAPILMGRGIDLIIDEGNVDFNGLIPILIKLAAVVTVTGISQWLMSLCTNKVTYNTVRDIRNDAFKNLQQLPLKYIDGHSHGDIMSRLVTDVEQISDGLIMGFAQLFTGIVTIFGTLFFMLSINVKITLAVVIITPISLFVARFIAKNTFKLFQKQSEARGEMTSLVEEMIGNQKVVKAFAYEKGYLPVFSDKAVYTFYKRSCLYQRRYYRSICGDRRRFLCRSAFMLPDLCKPVH